MPIPTIKAILDIRTACLIVLFSIVPLLASASAGRRDDRSGANPELT